jgi:hypothetical protein
MPHDDGRMTETFCGNKIGGGEEELLRCRTINCLINSEVAICSEAFRFTSKVTASSPKYLCQVSGVCGHIG